MFPLIQTGSLNRSLSPTYVGEDNVTSSPSHIQQLHLFVENSQVDDVKQLLVQYSFTPNELAETALICTNQDIIKILLVESTKENYLKPFILNFQENNRSIQLINIIRTLIEHYETNKSAIPKNVLTALLLISSKLDNKLFEMIHYKSINSEGNVFKNYEKIPKEIYLQSWCFFIKTKS